MDCAQLTAAYTDHTSIRYIRDTIHYGYLACFSRSQWSQIPKHITDHSVPITGERWNL